MLKKAYGSRSVSTKIRTATSACVIASLFALCLAPTHTESTTVPSLGKAPISVIFTPDPIKTGFTKDGSKDIKVSVVATVKPANAVSKIHISHDGPNEFTWSTPVVNADAGTLSFDVRGTAATPASKPSGDSSITAAIDSDSVLTRAPVVVIIPAAIGLPHPENSGVVNGLNQLLDGSTSPSVGRLPMGAVAMCTVYMFGLQVKVVDQFQSALDAMYDGVPVTENNGKYPLNQKISGGTYTDYVGVLASQLFNGKLIPAKRGGVNAGLWPTSQKVLPNPPTTQTVTNLSVEVGGHSLNPAIVNRKTSHSTDANGNVTVKVEWP